MGRTRNTDTVRDEARARLREWLKPGDTVYTILDHVSSSGMSRAIRLVIPYTREDGTIDHLHPNHAAGVLLGLRHWRRHGQTRDALVVGGCGMDMGFHLVYELSAALFGEGYACLGKGKCPSPYHVNHRDRIRCEGTVVYNPDGPNTGRRCYKPDRYLFRESSEVPPDWPRLPAIDIGDGQTIPGGYAACLTDDNGEHPMVCPTCHGVGNLPNPEGPERFDLIHRDGYALRHRWL